MAARLTPASPKPDKIWRDAIRLALARGNDKKSGKTIERLAKKLIEVAMDGDMGALKEIGDRLDGKATQMIGNEGDKPFKHQIEVLFKDR